MSRHSLTFKLLISYLAVVVLAAAAAFGVARWLGPRLFDHEVEQIGIRLGWVDGSPPGIAGGGPGQGQGRGGGVHADVVDDEVLQDQQDALDAELVDAFSGSLNIALLVALGVGALAGLAGAVLVSRRLVRPLRRMSEVVRRMAAGEHGERVPLPGDVELADLAHDVNELGEALEHTEERRTQLVSDLAHELRTPITSIDGFLEGLEDGVFEPDREILGAMRDETRRLQRLATDLGVLSRAAEQVFDLSPTELDLAEVARSAGRGLSASFAAKEVIFEPGEGSLPVRADRDRMGQVFTNLLRNSLQHTPAGETVRLDIGSGNGTARVTVADTGRGIAPTDLDRVFDRFYRAGQSSDRGAGIGLTIARAIVRAHGGDITAASEGPGAGAAFTVSLPTTGPR